MNIAQERSYIKRILRNNFTFKVILGKISNEQSQSQDLGNISIIPLRHNEWIMHASHLQMLLLKQHCYLTLM